jgi:hypothetical protein
MQSTPEERHQYITPVSLHLIVIYSVIVDGILLVML